MNNRKMLSLLVAVCFGVVLAGVALATDNKGPDTIVMDSKVFPEHKKSLVTFSHQKHNVDYNIACSECHHVYQDGKNVWKEGDPVQKCTECHSGDKAPSGLSKEEKIKGYYYDAVHENCKGCHKAAKAEGKAAPTGCTECHPKAAQ
jgi:hypothetical protein